MSTVPQLKKSGKDGRSTRVKNLSFCNHHSLAWFMKLDQQRLNWREGVLMQNSKLALILVTQLPIDCLLLEMKNKTKQKNSNCTGEKSGNIWHGWSNLTSPQKGR